MIRGQDVTELPGIGEDLASKIKEIVETGTAAMLEEHRKKVPATLTNLLKIPGLGPKRVQALYHKLGIRTLDELRSAAQEGRVRTLQGFGAKTEQHILEQLKARTSEAKRFKLAMYPICRGLHHVSEGLSRGGRYCRGGELSTS